MHLKKNSVLIEHFTVQNHWCIYSFQLSDRLKGLSANLSPPYTTSDQLQFKI